MRRSLWRKVILGGWILTLLSWFAPTALLRHWLQGEALRFGPGVARIILSWVAEHPASIPAILGTLIGLGLLLKSLGAGRDPGIFTIENQRVIGETLKKYANEHSNVHIYMASMQQKPLADTLKAVFDLAKWQTELFNVALEQQRHQYYEGIEVVGYNKHLVKAVVGAMRENGLSGVRVVVENPEVQPSHPSWNRVQNRLKITVGHGG